MSKTIQISDAQYDALQAGESITISAGDDVWFDRTLRKSECLESFVGWMPCLPPEPPEPPKRMMEYTVRRPEPMLEHPEYGQEYWLADPCHKNWGFAEEWRKTSIDKRFFNRGLCYSTKEEAVAAAKAMVGDE